ncbi:MAG: ATP-binding cassette domain-containing protein, partial [Rhodobacteraceae bacterium]|nr:ATP-binding cassette domain-containing protein [Paracoccaceae bacterium]
KVSWKGRDLGRMPSHQRAELGLCLVPEDRRILGGLTVLENLRVAYTGVPPSRRSATPDETIERFPMLVPIRDRAGGVLSGGQQQLLALARAAIANPSLLLLDEPTEGLAPVIVEELAEDVMRICEENECTLLLCEQSVWFSRRCTEHVHIIDSGKIVFSGGWDEFDANQDIQARHLAVA